ncbi:MAG: MFS transporter [Phycisphaerae bacterium]|nr:MFS transporter [Phycisphaerae bacterium]NNF44476.1 MFS transporter [Phycisphaerales bacterium]
MFGFTLAFFSSFGQTFFVGLFGGELRAAFAMSEGVFGSLYSLATLVSGCFVVWLGHLIDRVDLRLYATLVGLGLVAACLSIAAATTIVGLGVSIFALRLSGQGLLSHTAMTSMARYYERSRGMAISIAGLGFPAGEAVLPFAAVTLMQASGWRTTWQLIALIVGVTIVPLTLILLRGHGRRHATHVAAVDATLDPAAAAAPVRRQWTRREVLRDGRFYGLLPAALAPGFIVTGIFLHQPTLVAEKGWTPAWFAACFVGFAASQLPASLLAGGTIDRFGARRLVPLYLVPLIASLLVLAGWRHPAAALFFLVLAGITSGIGGPILGALWAELYGVRHLGSIRALVSALMVFATAGSPAIMGWLIDAEIGMAVLSAACAAGAAAAAVTARLALGQRAGSAASPDS